MASVKYNVVQPPTSGEVAGEALEKLGRSGVLELVLLASEQRVPAPLEQVVSFRIRKTGHPPEGGMIIEGATEDDYPRYISVRTHPDSAEPATAEIIQA